MRFLDYVSVNPKISLEKERIYPFVEMGDVSTSFRNPDKVEYKSFDSGVKFADGDTVIARITPCLQNGKRFYCKNIGKGFGSTEYLVFRPKDSSVDNLYLYYFMNTDFIKESMVRSMVGATGRQRVNNDVFSRLDVTFPNIEIQRRIAEILSTYDDLIENNRKQIKLLEEAAQRLYKEWFVDLRFPGHENTKITDGIPEGWRMAVLSEIASVNKESISKQYPYDYVDYIDIGAVSKGQINSVTRLSTKDAPGRAKRIAFDGDVLWGMVRPNLKSYALVFHPKETSVFSTGFAILHAEKVPFSFLYCHVTQDEFVSYLINCTNGAAYPAVKPSHFENAVLLVPTDMVLSKFHSLVGQMFRQAEILEQKNQQAIEARDRLLPKLMSGEIEVEK